MVQTDTDHGLLPEATWSWYWRIGFARRQQRTFPSLGFQNKFFFLTHHNSIQTWFSFVALKQHSTNTAIFHLKFIQIVWEPSTEFMDIHHCSYTSINCFLRHIASANCWWVWVKSSYNITRFRPLVVYQNAYILLYKNHQFWIIWLLKCYNRWSEFTVCFY